MERWVNNDPIRSQFCTCRDSLGLSRGACRILACWVTMIETQAKRYFNYEPINHLWYGYRQDCRTTAPLPWCLMYCLVSMRFTSRWSPFILGYRVNSKNLLLLISRYVLFLWSWWFPRINNLHTGLNIEGGAIEKLCNNIGISTYRFTLCVTELALH